MSVVECIKSRISTISLPISGKNNVINGTQTEKVMTAAHKSWLFLIWWVWLATPTLINPPILTGG
ncbi:hypothetical protein EAC26_12140 [Enterococcus faecium]|uniref:Uncharacterized protein n=3 Tax=Enterococcus TaxID=1350 RepID=D2U556_ENTCA|nr:hypothetical protein [Enterococcus faecalis]EAD5765842.1 hypothetical protein [Listeria innocua]EFQ17611.1 hypothetical protein HMPREF9512_00046 [Enterococcus faecalis EnGen0311]EGP5233899.1 hypothetical protein [Enterococcus faecium]KAF1303723.1 hypothetical protein BAU17_11075 [Enterococcus sp. CU12B]PCD92092.1 hypothetical protein CKY18_13670 [Enterococcus gallinarum]TXV45553.1 hypothetical protein D4M89_14185 [Enterococcus sp. T0101B.F-10]CBG92848.1 hypothetical protein [Enterococcus 